MSDDDGDGGAPSLSQLGRYSLIRRIGKGGMGEVYLGKVSGAHGFEKAVAIKRILPQFSANPHVVNMLVDEARISVLLNHPNVVQVLELGEDNGDYFIVMEFVDGHALSRLLRRLKNSKKRFEPLEACYIAVQVLEGLHAAHVQKDHRGQPAGIIHRDVSPQNVLVSMDGMIKVIDFGIARARERLEVTQGSSVKGKLRYMAPEQLSAKMLKGKSLDHRVDVFAGGIVLFEMLGMRQRFGGDNEPEIMQAIIKEETPDLAKEGLIDRELMDVVDTALEKNRDERFPDAATFAAKLRTYLYKRDPGFTAERIARRMREAFGGENNEDDERKSSAPNANAPLHENDDGDVDRTKTAFRPREVEAERIARRDAQSLPPSQGGAGTGTFAGGTAMRRRKQRSRGPAVLAGLIVGGGVLAAAYFLVVKPDMKPDGTGPDAGAVAPTDGDPLANQNGVDVEILVEAEPPTTRISVPKTPERRYVSPARLHAKRGETLELAFDADGYVSEKHTIVAGGGAPSLKVALVPMAVELIVTVTPKDAVVTVDDRPYEPGMKVVPDRPIQIKATHPFAQPKTLMANPRAGEPLPVTLVLDQVTPGTRDTPRATRGTLKITSIPSHAEVFVDGKKLPGTTPVEAPMSAGKHKVTVRSGANEKTFNVDIVVNEVTRQNVDFEK